MAACTDPEPAPGDEPLDCAALSDSLFPPRERTGLATFKVVEPNSGAFKAGDRMKVVVSGVDYSSALVDFVVVESGGEAGRIPGFPKNNGIKPRETCVFEFAVPESLVTIGGRTISLVSDSVKIRISDYSDPDSYDYSEDFLSITR